MKFLLTTFFILNIVILNAQVEQIESIAESSVIHECVQFVNGEIRDKITNELLPEAEVVLSDQDGNVLETQIVKENAVFSFIIKCGKTYKVEGSKVEFTAESKEFTTSKETNKKLKILISLGKGNIDFITNAKAKKTEIKIVEIKNEVIPDVPLEKIVIVNNDVNINPIYFDYESSYLNKEAKIDLQKLVVLMNKYPKMVIECAAHTDSKGPDNYNVWMADRRAKRAIDYMIDLGINSTRITGKGYGATQLVNKCSRDVECTDAQHAKNRRTEFVVIKT